MGCNYYVELRKRKTCTSCGHTDEADLFHIGKSSYGWAFSINVQGQIENWEDMKDFIKDYQIVDEYDRKIGYMEFLHIVENRRREKPKGWDELKNSSTMFMDENFYLMRHSMDGIFCVGNEYELPIDYLCGEYS